MSYFKQLVASAIQYSASHLYCAVGYSPAIRKSGRLEFLQVKKSSLRDLEDMTNEILCQETKDRLAERGQVQVVVEYDGSHTLHVSVSKSASGNIIAVLIRNLFLPTRESMPKELIKAITLSRGGLILLGGAYSHNKDLTIQRLLSTVCETNKRFVLTFGLHNADYHHLPDNSMVGSYSASEANLDLLRHSAADLVVFGELSPNTMMLAQDCVMMGMIVVVSVDSSSPSHTIARTLSMFNERGAGMGFLSSYLLGIAFQVLLVTQVNGTCLYLYDFVKCDDPLRQAIKNDAIDTIECSGIVEQMNKLIEENKLVYYDAQPTFMNLTSSSSLYGDDVDAF